MKLIHGGDIYGYAERHGGGYPLDLSANINPRGIPERVRRAMQEAINRCDRYPDPLCRALRRAVAAAEEVPESWLYFGNGAADVLFRFADALNLRAALLTAPTFAEYEQSLRGCAIQYHALRETEGFTVTPRILQEITPGLNAVYLCNPNNPTGCTVEPALLQKILCACESVGAYLLVDECFLDFLADADARTLKPFLADHPKLILLRAFTKMYAVPGVRLGYCMSSDHALLARLYNAGQPWNVSVIAQACGVAAAGLKDFARQTACLIAEERQFLVNALQANGLTVFDGQANFLLWKSRDALLHEKMEQNGVLIRNCANYTGLGPGFFRTAIRLREDNEHFLKVLDGCLRQES